MEEYPNWCNTGALWSSPGKKDKVNEELTATLLVFTQSVVKSDRLRKAYWGSWYLLPSKHRHGLVKHYLLTYEWCPQHWTDWSSSDLANRVVRSLTLRTSAEQRTSLLSSARFIDKPHQEKPGSPKQCLHSCQAAMHTQTLAYFTVRHWRSADTNTPKQKKKTLKLM